ncbi:putative aspartate aminotransferase, cytoplasmic 2 [Synchiropus splendidus]|uniref:putative aspartate aminotransferase, cytoplasmic 2 n=1 Tax=Synchiropus splendidus TaxID=270530 RepID=UPI00237E4335|nr:putative aspartate aminotransferase, cytoplasmic 2 [Synchiropus splendidus]
MNRPEGNPDEKGLDQNKGTTSVFRNTQAADLSAESRLLSAFRKDTHACRVYLAGRECLNEDGGIFHLGLVQKIKQQMSRDPTLSLQHPSVLGLSEFNRRANEVAVGRSSTALVENRVLGIQTPGFTGAVRLAAELLKSWYDATRAWDGPLYLSSPCDDMLCDIFQAAGIRDIRRFRYWSDEQCGVCLENLLEDLEEAPEASVIVLSASGHYPTGADLSQDQWRIITQLAVRRKLFPVLLLPTPPLCSGDPWRDAWPVQYCVSLGMELFCVQSFSHSFGLHGEAVGHLLCVPKSSSLLRAVRSQAEKLAQTLWAPPCTTGAHVVAAVLSNPAHLAEWRLEVTQAVERCMLVREVLRERLRLLGTPGNWDHLTQQRGLYCCLGMNGQQVDFLAKQRHVYVLPGGCLNISAINGRNLDYIAESIYQCLTTRTPH